jgi:hypothetical protein
MPSMLDAGCSGGAFVQVRLPSPFQANGHRLFPYIFENIALAKPQVSIYSRGYHAAVRQEKGEQE